MGTFCDYPIILSIFFLFLFSLSLGMFQLSPRPAVLSQVQVQIIFNNYCIIQPCCHIGCSSLMASTVSPDIVCQVFLVMSLVCNKPVLLILTKTMRRSSSTELSKEQIPCYKSQVRVKSLNSVLLLPKLICLVRAGFPWVSTCLR